MTLEHLKASSAVTISHLEGARLYLPLRLGSEAAEQMHEQFNEYLDQIELDLALDTAESLGSACNAPPEFWTELQLAAATMQLAENEARYAALAAP